MSTLIENLAPTDLSSLIGSDFTALTVPQPVTLTLAKIDIGVPRPGFRTPFALTFTSDWSVLLLEAQYRLVDENRREHLMHLVPVGDTPNRQRCYMAYFN
ncbi:DUF6916 family protein [Pseudomonas lopnurensis]|uniref:DUF6916 family protein n=1 Tax=Pseudomonas lopnurensis TaxID=1477517 RepID=UPI00187A1150|nr:hypothetical protein [Pseudomonas lopnurensis]MBE7373375.1 hypothetical protein [Pseudomonas lopnurensis]